MVPSLQWLLLLWGLQGLWAQDYEEDYEEEGVTTRKKNRQFPSNLIAQNGKCKSKIVSFYHHFIYLRAFLFSPLMLLLGKVVWNMCRWNMFQGAATYEIIEHDTQQGHRWRMQSTWIISLGFLRAIHLLCDCSVLCYPNVLFAQNPVSPGTFPLWHISVKINVIYPQPILDLWPPSFAEGWCSKLSLFPLQNCMSRSWTYHTFLEIASSA